MVGSNGLDEMDGNCSAYSNDLYRVKSLNEYKQAWMAGQFVGIDDSPAVIRKRRKNGRDPGQIDAKIRRYMKSEVDRGVARAGLGVGLAAARYAAKSQMTGSLGIALRVGGRIGVRAIPLVGAALFAYDIYQFGKWVAE